ncbi:MAG: hypothetical protein AAF327_23250 [Cyanobacteria bacterium P01_A01_bin.37]
MLNLRYDLVCGFVCTLARPPDTQNRSSDGHGEIKATHTSSPSFPQEGKNSGTAFHHLYRNAPISRQKTKHWHDPGSFRGPTPFDR